MSGQSYEDNILPYTEEAILDGHDATAAAIVLAGRAIAASIYKLGMADACTPMGAIESHGIIVRDAARKIASAISRDRE